MMCMKELAAAGHALGADVDGPSGTGDYQTLVLAKSKAQLEAIWATTEACLNRAYANKKSETSARSGVTWLWFTQNGPTLNWCGIPAPGVDKLGGRGPQKDWYAIWIACRSNQKSLPDVNKGIFW